MVIYTVLEADCKNQAIRDDFGETRKFTNKNGAYLLRDGRNNCQKLCGCLFQRESASYSFEQLD